jgi:UDP-2-acetamido-2,6-beta-L-arabino-hexul-4-ose reductase
MYANRVLPDLSDDFTLALFNSLRSYLHSPVGIQELPVNRDDRGSLFETVRGGGGGQSFVSMSHPGVVRGNHYHRRKVERFVVLQGQACIRIRRLFDDEIVEYRVSDEMPVSIDMPTLHTHSITNVGKSELVTLFWAHEVFDPERPDTFREPVR